MSGSNYERMLALAEEVFAVKNDTEQLDVNQSVLQRLMKIHPATVSEYDTGDGPVAWILLIPTTLSLMHQFIDGSISEKQLFEQTPLDAEYDALYLCSALVLEEHRRKGIAKRLVVEAVDNIRKDHSLQALFIWAFSKEGDLGAEALAKLTSIPFYKRLN